MSLEIITLNYERGGNLGVRKQELVRKVKADWILILDTDEVASEELKKEVETIEKGNGNKKIVGYRIPFQNYVFDKPVYWGGERYSKIRLFKRGYGRVTPVPVHEEVVVSGPIGDLNGVIHHHSYGTPWQVLKKFTYYAWLVAKEKSKAGEPIIIKKLFLYGPHMFWSRFIKEHGYRDGWRGLFLASAFAYMELLTYIYLLIMRTLKI